MARRRGPGVWTDDQYDELGLGRFGFHPRLRRRQCKVPQWCPQCSNGWTCASYFASRQEMEDAYWDLRDRLFADEHPGHRPWTYWRFEAPGVCRHEPRCDVPDGNDAQWLDEHDQLTVRERATLAEWASTREAGG